jgi:hypothetical protein
MPVRKIPMSRSAVTGSLPSPKNGSVAAFESSLERDFLIVLEFDLNVSRFEVQPVRIEYPGPDEKPRTYVPDALVFYRTDIVPARWMKPWLCEIKPWRILGRKAAEFEPKFRAARAYAAERGWEFRVLTEREIRRPYLDNAKFLLPYRKMAVPDEHATVLLEAVHQLRETDPDGLLAAVRWDRWSRAEIIPALWRLVANRRIGADLTLPITMRSRIWSVDPP